MKNLKNAIMNLLSVMLATSMFFACGSESTSSSEKPPDGDFKNLPGSVLISGMSGCENLFLDNDSMKIYVTDLSGYLYLVNGETHETMEIVTSIKIGNMGFGIDKGPDGYLYFSASENTSDSCSYGDCIYNAAIYRIDMDLELPITKITNDYRGINGVTFDASGGCYFTSSTLDSSNLQGEVYRMQVTADGAVSSPEVFLADAGYANGLYYDSNQELIYFSQSSQARNVFTFSPSNPSLQEVVSVLADDLCTDKSGRVWISCGSGLRMYDPNNEIATNYTIEGLGNVSSCRIREEDGKEFIYITEIDKPLQPLTTFDGRGIAVIPLDSLLQL